MLQNNGQLIFQIIQNQLQQRKLMSLKQPLINPHKVLQSDEVQPIQANLNYQDNQQKNLQARQQKKRKIKFFIVFFIIILTSFQVYSVTTIKLQHSRMFIRFLHAYILDHTDPGIYWLGQTMINYPIQQFQTVQDFKVFLKQLNEKLQTLDEKVFGFIDFQQFLLTKNKITVQPKNGQIIEYDYIIADGFEQPFNVEDVYSIKNSVLQSQQIQIILAPFNINSHEWNVMFSITTQSDCSVYVRLYAAQTMPLWRQHLTTFTMGVILLIYLVVDYLQNPKNYIQNMPEYLMCVFLVNTFFVSFNEDLDVKWVVILDGIQCLISWLLILKFVQKQDDYHISFLLKKSYILLARLFISFFPIFFAFAIFAYCIFCRQAWQFSTFKRTFLTLFYISYYNATYQSFVVTSRSNPISMIFFFSFIILFTICVYSGMLVSVFCSYVWNKRQTKIKQDIVNNLKIQCTQCNYKYKYVDCLKQAKNPKKSLKMSFIMQIDLKNSDQRYQYKKILQKKLHNLGKKAGQLIQSTKKMFSNQRIPFFNNYKVALFEKMLIRIKEVKKQFKTVQQQQLQKNSKQNISNKKFQQKND